MDLQSMYYLVGVIFMILMISLVIALAFFVIRLQQSIESIRHTVNTKVEHIKSNTNGELSGIASGLITSFILSKLKDMVWKKKSHSD